MSKFKCLYKTESVEIRGNSVWSVFLAQVLLAIPILILQLLILIFFIYGKV
jgi:hypothetical protein